MTDFSRSYAARWKLYRVDERTWADGEEVRGLTSATVKRVDSGLSESGEMTLVKDVGSQLGESYYRLVMIATQDGTSERHDIATLSGAVASGNIDRGTDEVKLTCTSVLERASHVGLGVGQYVPTNADCVRYARDLLSKHTPAPVEAAGTFRLNGPYVFDVGETVLSAVQGLLEAGGWIVTIDARGRVLLRKRPELDARLVERRHLMAGTGYNTDLSSVPNRYTVFDTSYGYMECVNNSPSSPVSTVNRGYVRDPAKGIDQKPVPIDGESMYDYCKRKLKELSKETVTVSYQREYIPDLYVGDTISQRYIMGENDGTMRVTSQTLKCSNGIVVSETAMIERDLWPN